MFPSVDRTILEKDSHPEGGLGAPCMLLQGGKSCPTIVGNWHGLAGMTQCWFDMRVLHVLARQRIFSLFFFFLIFLSCLRQKVERRRKNQGSLHKLRYDVDHRLTQEWRGESFMKHGVRYVLHLGESILSSKLWVSCRILTQNITRYSVVVEISGSIHGRRTEQSAESMETISTRSRLATEEQVENQHQCPTGNKVRGHTLYAGTDGQNGAPFALPHFLCIRDPMRSSLGSINSSCPVALRGFLPIGKIKDLPCREAGGLFMTCILTAVEDLPLHE